MNRAFAAAAVFDSAKDKVEKQQLGHAEFADLIEHTVLPAWIGARQSLVDVTPIPPSLERDVTSICSYMPLQQDYWQALMGIERDADEQASRTLGSVFKTRILATIHAVDDFAAAEGDVDRSAPSTAAEKAAKQRLQEYFSQIEALEKPRRLENCTAPR